MITEYYIRKDWPRGESRYAVTVRLSPSWQNHHDHKLGLGLVESLPTPHLVEGTVYPHAVWEGGGGCYYPIQVSVYMKRLPTEEEVELWQNLYQENFSNLMEEAEKIRRINRVLKEEANVCRD